MNSNNWKATDYFNKIKSKTCNAKPDTNRILSKVFTNTTNNDKLREIKHSNNTMNNICNSQSDVNCNNEQLPQRNMSEIFKTQITNINRHTNSIELVKSGESNSFSKTVDNKHCNQQPHVGFYDKFNESLSFTPPADDMNELFRNPYFRPQRINSHIEEKPISDIIDDSTPIVKIATHIDIAKIIEEKVLLRFHHGGIYYFDGSVNKFLTQETANNLLENNCSTLIEQYGKDYVVDEFEKFLNMIPETNAEQIIDSASYIGFRQGIWDINTDQFLDKNYRNYFILCKLDLDYNKAPSKEPVNFNEFINTLSHGNIELSNRIWEAIGYLIKCDMQGGKCILLQGKSDSGKKEFSEFLSSFFKKDSLFSINVNSTGETTDFLNNTLVGKRICNIDITNDVLDNKTIDIIKGIIDNDLVDSDVKYKENAKAINTCKVLCTANPNIGIEDKDDAFLNQLVVIPLECNLTELQIASDVLFRKLEKEKLDIVKKAAGYYNQLRTRNYSFSGNFELDAVVKNDSILLAEKYPYDKSIKMFVENCCELTGNDIRTFTYELHNAYISFCGDHCMTNILTDSSMFSKRLKSIYSGKIESDVWLDEKISSNKKRGYRGIKLL